MSRSTLDSFNIVCRLDHDGKLDESSQDKKQKVATGLIRDKLHTQDFAGPVSLRASKVLGPISRFRDVEILLLMKLGVTVGSRPAHHCCNGLCTCSKFSH